MVLGARARLLIEVGPHLEVVDAGAVLDEMLGATLEDAKEVVRIPTLSLDRLGVALLGTARLLLVDAFEGREFAVGLSERLRNPRLECLVGRTHGYYPGEYTTAPMWGQRISYTLSAVGRLT